MTKLLDVSSLNVRVSNKSLLKDVSFSVKQSELVAFIGPNGAGKTTFIKSVMGFLPNPEAHADSNRIVWRGTVINTLSVAERVEQGLGYLPQHNSLLADFSVDENLDLVYRYHPRWEKRTKSEFDAEKRNLLDRCAPSVNPNQPSPLLSGGQKRRIELVRVLLGKPQLLILDEPFAGVDPKSIYELKALLKSLVSPELSMIVSDHHIQELLSIADYGFLMLEGTVIEKGTIESLLKNSTLKQRYLGEEFHTFVTQHIKDHPDSSQQQKESE